MINNWNKYFTIGLLIIQGALLGACSGTRYIPVKCNIGIVCKNDSCDGNVIQTWIYDEVGSLTIDSMFYLGNTPSQPHITEYYHYKSDAVIICDANRDTSFIKLNEKGFPVSVREKWGDSFEAFFNKNGSLKEIKSTRLNGIGKLWHTTIDSIIYIDGNVVAYRSRMDNLAADSFTVYCTYYKDTLYKPFDATDKILSVSNSALPVQGRFKAQNYSRNLLKTIAINGTIMEYYKYELDNDGKVTRMFKTFDPSGKPWTNTYTFEYRRL